MENELANCTHPVPKNRFGIFAMHCMNNQLFSKRDYKRLFAEDGPMAAAESKLKNELQKPVIVSDYGNM